MAETEVTVGNVLIFYNDGLIATLKAIVPEAGQLIYPFSDATQFRVMRVTMRRKHFEVDVELV